eukprot:187539-Hanusia_phi.AAC.2
MSRSHRKFINMEVAPQYFDTKYFPNSLISSSFKENCLEVSGMKESRDFRDSIIILLSSEKKQNDEKIFGTESFLQVTGNATH